VKLRAHAPRVATRDTRAVRPPPKSVDPWYNTPAHRAWAGAVVARSGRCCQDAAHQPGTPRSGRRLFADHIVERRDGGDPTDIANGMARCGSCHSRKTLAERARRAGAVAPSVGGAGG
jgi:5-methylcytosine-specific restriction protein A